MPQIYDMRPKALLPPEGRRVEDFFALKNPTASAGFEPADLGTQGQHATPRPPKPTHSQLPLQIFKYSFLYIYYVLSFRHFINNLVDCLRV